MKKIFTLSIFCLITFIYQAQTYVGDISLNTQEDIDNFSTNYPGITYVEGILSITSMNLGGITNLSGLNQLTGARDLIFNWILQDPPTEPIGWAPSTGENFSIYLESQLPSTSHALALSELTSGFSNLNSINLSVVSIDQPTNWVLFENLISVDSLFYSMSAFDTEVTIPSLMHINYMNYQNISNITSALHLPNVITLNTILCENQDPNGFAALNSTPIFSSLLHIEHFSAFEVDVIDGFSGLSSLTSIGTFRTLYAESVNNLIGLTNIHTANVIDVGSLGQFNPQPLIGLESLETVGRLSLAFGNLEGDLSALSNLQSVDSLMLGYPIGNFALPGPAGLTSLQGIENVTINNYLSLVGQDLSFCSVPSVCNFISSHGPEDYFIDVNNPFGCSSDVEVLSACGDPGNSTVFGSIYFDSNCNGLIDDNEFTISPSYLEVSPASDIFLGQSNFYVSAAPQTTINLNATNLPNQYAVSTPVTITTSQFGGTVTNQNVLVCPAFDFNDLQVSILQFEFLGPGFTSIWKLQVNNNGTTELEFNPEVVINSPELVLLVQPLEGSFSNNTITWATTSISPGQTLEFDFNITLLPTATILGEMFSATASANLVSGTDENPADNTALFEQEIIGAYDPNDKWVNTPQINIETIDPTQPLDLTYRVRFQNTGTAPAVNVRVEDILEEDLDPSTFQLLSSTHEVFYQIEGNQINFFFDNIMLPDSTSDPEGSIGTFFFRIKSNGNHSLESSIDNQVSIFFDFNEPIITNVASTIFYNCPVVNISGEGVDLCAGEELELSAVVSNNTSIQWLINEEVVSSSNNYLFSFDEPNDYSVLVVAENEYCIDEDELEITVNENPEVTLVLDGSTLIATEGFASYQWTLNGNIIEGENGNTLSSPAIGNYVVSVTNEFGCTDESDVVEVVIGINELNNSPVVLWPNPAKDILNIQSDYRGVATIVDMQGKQVMSITLNGQATLDLSGLSSGVYQITSSIGMMERFIKE
jgi:hypothetical protein